MPNKIGNNIIVLIVSLFIGIVFNAGEMRAAYGVFMCVALFAALNAVIMVIKDMLR